MHLLLSALKSAFREWMHLAALRLARHRALNCVRESCVPERAACRRRR